MIFGVSSLLLVFFLTWAACIEYQIMSRCIRIGQICVSGTDVHRTEVVRHDWGVLNTASAAYSHLEGSMV